METIKLRIKRTSYINADNGYVVLKGESEKRLLTAVGYLPEALDSGKLEGSDFELDGQWEMSRFGRQFAFTEARLTTNQLFYFLAKVVKGLGDKLAQRLLDHYGEKQLLLILEKEPDRLLEFKGIKEKKLSLIKTSWNKQKNLRALSEFLLPHGITPNLLVRIFNAFGDQASQKIHENPYSLTEIRGIGFKTADIIAQKLGLPFASEHRIEAAIHHLLLEAGDQDGHTYLTPNILHEQLSELLDDGEKKLAATTFEQVIRSMQEKDRLVVDQDQRIALKAFHYMESFLETFFRRRSQERFPPLAELATVNQFIDEKQQRLGFPLASEQRRIITLIGTGRRRLYALSGYAGTGKSTIAKTILDFLAEHFCERKEITCCAFTGMAAARIRKLSGYQAYTIHSLLKYQGDNRFEFNREKPLPYKVILLDEAGMVNSQIFYRLALAVAEGTIFIMVGDPAQLPPIGAGNVFADILGKNYLAHISLTRIFRQSEDSVLVYFANIIRKGEIPPDYERNYHDFIFIREEIPNYFQLKKELPEKELREIRGECNDRIRQLILELAAKAVKRLKFPTWDFQVLTPVRRGPLGTELLNQQLQEVFNPHSLCQTERFGTVFKVDDKVVHLQNKDMDCTSYTAGFNPRQAGGWRRQRIFNGFVGIIKDIDLENELFYVVYPGPLVVRYNFDHIRDIIDLAYCLTVHKAQGSQYKYVAIPLSNSHFMMLNNKWFYTAITRAEKKVYLIGQEFALKRSCTNIEAASRNTFLSLDRQEHNHLLQEEEHEPEQKKDQ
ncbi:MAG: AAA family ATPase [Deltaproteobacteria bacterium]|nr:AAA family ATPase [Deltaproteobacteria bacterium]